MVLQTEIKDFVRKVLLLAILLSILVNLAFTYYRSVTGESVATASSVTSNDTTFQRSGVPYLGDTGVAISLNIGLSDKDSKEIPVRLYEDVLPISQVLSDKSLGEKKIISSHMVAASEYLNVLKTDVRKLLDQSSDRAAMLESFLDQLKYRYTATNNYLSSLASQKSELEAALATAQGKTESVKTGLSSSYKNFDYDKTEEYLAQYLDAKEKETYASTYLVFVNKFISTYTVLNTYNKKLLDTLINNREALIKNVTIVLPDTGNELMGKLKLIQTEADYKAGK